MYKRLLATAIFALSLVGCIMPTTYHPFNGRDGYQTVQLNNNLFEVRFSGNTATTKESVHNMMLYRAAQVTRNHGRTYFTVLSEKTQRHRQVFVNPGYESTTVKKNRHHKERVTTYTPPSKMVENSFTTIIRFKLSGNNASDRTYNAKTLMQSLRPQINWPKPKQ
jgi:hypothetical protein